MKNSKIKIAVFFVWLIGMVGFVTFQKSVSAEAISTIPKPDLKEVEKFNALILDRFLTQPSLGFGRLVPTPTPSLHLSTENSQTGKLKFSPKDENERNSIINFEQKGWKIGLYLFGKSANTFYIPGKTEPEVSIDYRLFKPIAITENIKENDLTKPEKILEKAKVAFDEFQFSEKSKKKIFEFESEGWWYLAKPVRAVNQSCVDCHTGNAVARAIRTGKYEFRSRRIGDVNGVLVYAFQKVKK